MTDKPSEVSVEEMRRLIELDIPHAEGMAGGWDRWNEARPGFEQANPYRKRLRILRAILKLIERSDDAIIESHGSSAEGGGVFPESVYAEMVALWEKEANRYECERKGVYAVMHAVQKLLQKQAPPPDGGEEEK